eukprot:4359017-Amphidinium_carterae.1
MVGLQCPLNNSMVEERRVQRFINSVDLGSAPSCCTLGEDKTTPNEGYGIPRQIITPRIA